MNNHNVGIIDTVVGKYLCYVFSGSGSVLGITYLWTPLL